SEVPLHATSFFVMRAVFLGAVWRTGRGWRRGLKYAIAAPTDHLPHTAGESDRSALFVQDVCAPRHHGVADQRDGVFAHVESGRVAGRILIFLHYDNVAFGFDPPDLPVASRPRYGRLDGARAGLLFGKNDEHLAMTSGTSR